MLVKDDHLMAFDPKALSHVEVQEITRVAREIILNNNIELDNIIVKTWKGYFCESDRHFLVMMTNTMPARLLLSVVLTKNA